MSLQPATGRWVIWVSVLLSLMLVMLPLPDWLAIGRPHWVVLVVIYWCIALPYRVGVIFAWCCGLFLDVVMTEALGVHAAALAVTGYLAVIVSHQVRMFAVWQQAGVVALLLFPYQLLWLWLSHVAGDTGLSPWQWLPWVSSTLLWPPVAFLLRESRLHFRVS